MPNNLRRWGLGLGLLLVAGLGAAVALDANSGYRDMRGNDVPGYIPYCVNAQSRAVPCPTPAAGGGAANSNPGSDYARDGADGAGTNPGSGIRGWLSGIYARLSGTLQVNVSNQTADPSTGARQDTGNGSAATTALNTSSAATALGAKSDSQAGDETGSWSVVALLKRISAGIRSTIRVDGSAVTQPVSGTVTSLPGGLSRSRQTCTLPAYAAGGSVVCTDSSGAQTSATCAASTGCLVSAPLSGRRTAFFMNRTSGTTIDIGYSSAVAPGNSIGLDGPSASGGQGGSIEENPAHTGSYYAASPAASTLVFVQGQ